MPSDNLFNSQQDPTFLLSEAHLIFGGKNLAERLDVDRKTLTRWKKAPDRLPIARQLALREILRSVPRQPEEADFTFIDLFAGIGGIRAGFSAARGRCVFTGEWNPWAQKIYTANYGADEPLVWDITSQYVSIHSVLYAVSAITGGSTLAWRRIIAASSSSCWLVHSSLTQ